MMHLDPKDWDVCRRIEVNFSGFPLDALVEQKAYNIHKLHYEDLPVYEHLLTPPSWEQFSRAHSLQNAILYGVSCLNIPLGILVATRRCFDTSPLILTLHVDPQYRGHGIGSRLIKALETEYPQKPRLHMWTHMLKPELLTSYNSFLTSCGYTPNPKTFLHCSGTASTIRLPFKHRPAMHSFNLIPWHKLPASEEREILQRLKDENFSGLNPFFYGDNITDFNSFVIRKNSQLVGWAVNTFATAEKIHYGSYYLLPKYRATGIGGYVINYCLQLHSERIPEFPYWSTCFLMPLDANNRHDRYFQRFATETYTRQEWY